jgi:hypothetical protein
MGSDVAFVSSEVHKVIPAESKCWHPVPDCLFRQRGGFLDRLEHVLKQSLGWGRKLCDVVIYSS